MTALLYDGQPGIQEEPDVMGDGLRAEGHGATKRMRYNACRYCAGSLLDQVAGPSITDTERAQTSKRFFRNRMIPSSFILPSSFERALRSRLR